MDPARIAKRVLSAYWLLIFFGTHLPATAVERIKRHKEWPFRGFGIVMHSLMYGGWAVLWCWVLWRARRGRLRFADLAAVWLVAGAYAVIDEATQLLVGRTAKADDVFVDLLAVTVVFSVAFGLSERRRAPEPAVG